MCNQPTRLPPGKIPALRLMPMPADLNPAGDVFGGWIMSQVDIAGAQPAIKRARSRVATVAVNSFLFKQPVSVGTVDVNVYAERNPENPIVVKVTEAVLTYVALDANRNKIEVPPEIIESE